jgi:4-hydroxy-tetrahydrodipicolinate reductase
MKRADQPIRISLFAPNGRMGKAIAMVVAEEPDFTIDQDHGDVLVDFSAPDALPESIGRAISAGIPILVGTTGLDESADAQIAAAA